MDERKTCFSRTVGKPPDLKVTYSSMDATYTITSNKLRFGTCIRNMFVVVYTGCLGGEVPDFGRMFLTLKYTDITQNTYI